MNIQTLIICVFIGAIVAFPGCKTGEKRKLTDWSIPTVKLTPHSKDEKPVRPAEKASPESTANLAHDRLKGHNPTAAIRANDDDPTLRPDPQEIAQLNQFEGRQTSDWTTGALPPAPEASAPVPAERIAQNVTNQTIAAEAPSQTAPSTTSADSAVGYLNGDLPDSVDSLPNAPTAVAAAPAPGMTPNSSTPLEPQAGTTMTELPGTNGGAIPVSATVPAQPMPGTQAQPAVLFMPGNINPQYPNAPRGN